jgi:hypothetical protein
LDLWLKRKTRQTIIESMHSKRKLDFCGSKPNLSSASTQNSPLKEPNSSTNQLLAFNLGPNNSFKQATPADLQRLDYVIYFLTNYLIDTDEAI